MAECLVLFKVKGYGRLSVFCINGISESIMRVNICSIANVLDI